MEFFLLNCNKRKGTHSLGRARTISKTKSTRQTSEKEENIFFGASVRKRRQNCLKQKYGKKEEQ